MKEFEDHIEFYRGYWHQHFSKTISADEWGDKKIAEEYLDKYWLREYEYKSEWKPVQDQIFLENEKFPDLVYHKEFEVMVANGGCLFIEEDFKQLQEFMIAQGEKYFVVIQNIHKSATGEPMFRMKFPVNITWQELTSGNYISAVLFEMSMNEYYVFGASCNWGRYSANDYERPLDIIGFRHNVSLIFQEHFHELKKEEKELWKWIPEDYKKTN